MRLWLRDYRRRNPHTIDEAYKNAIETELKNCAGLLEALPVEGEGAAPVGVNTDFRLPANPGRPPGSLPGYEIKPYLSADFQTSIEARRLFWAYAYMLEMNLAMDQLRWIYDGHAMPWEFLQDISRHLWDESRHGDSGHSRLLDFDITIPDVGFAPYDGLVDAVSVEPLSSKDLYEAVFFIGLIAETGHFTVKRQAYDDFLEGGDLESAEMMLFDIIDETTHVQYAHKWLPLLAEKAGVDNTGYKERAAGMRRESQQKHHENLRKWAELPRDLSNPNYAKYQELLNIMRERQPLLNAETCAPRDPLPM